VNKTNRKSKSDIDMVPIYQIDPLNSKDAKSKQKSSVLKNDPQRVFGPEMILGIIERIKKL